MMNGWTPPTRIRSRQLLPQGLIVTALVVAGVSLPGTAGHAQESPGEPLPLRPEVAAAADDAPDVRLHGGGWGHGVGMSQFGAYAQARAGRSVDDILGLYYPGTQLSADDRSSTQRVRVNIEQSVDSTTFAADVDVPVRACGPEGGGPVSGRIAHDDCQDLGVVPAGTTIRVCVHSDRLDLVVATAQGRSADCATDPLHTTTRPVVRVLHHGTTLRTPPAFAGSETRRFSDGWRDVHRQRQTQPPPLPPKPILHAVQDVPSVERYLEGLAEVPSSWGQDGPAALEAQAITGRTFALSRPSHRADCSCQLRSTPADQVYNGDEKREAAHGQLWVGAVQATADRVLTYDGALAKTFYSSSHGGRSENLEDSWAFGSVPEPYLRSVDDPWSLDPVNPRASWTALADNAVLAGFVSTGSDDPLVTVMRLAVTSRTDGGTPRDIEVTGVTATGQPTTFTFSGRAQDAKSGTGMTFAGNSIKLALPILEGGQPNARVYSSQITGFSFGPFDDDNGSVHEFAISWAHLAGIVAGVDDTRFAPGEPVTRAQMATFLVNTFDVPAADDVEVFPDVPVDNVHAEAIDAAAQVGLTAGFDDGTYRPGDPVTRQQMASFLARALALSSDSTGTFTDVRSGNVHRPAIEALSERGITRGCDDERYCPGDPVKRGQLASFVHRVVTG